MDSMYHRGGGGGGVGGGAFNPFGGSGGGAQQQPQSTFPVQQPGAGFGSPWSQPAGTHASSSSWAAPTASFNPAPAIGVGFGGFGGAGAGGTGRGIVGGGSMGSLEDLDGNMSSPSSQSHGSSQLLTEEEPPLLEELGINFEHIRQKVISTLNPKRNINDIVDDADLAGPLLFCVALGVLLSLRGKLHFDYIYHFFVFGSVLMCVAWRGVAFVCAASPRADPPSVTLRPPSLACAHALLCSARAAPRVGACRLRPPNDPIARPPLARPLARWFARRQGTWC
jgi:hypothetical protein